MMKKTYLGLLVFCLSFTLVEAQVEKSPVAPDYNKLQQIIDEAYKLFENDSAGAPADYIPELARVEPDLFGISVVTVDGRVFSAGHVEHCFSIQSISKVFTLAMVMEQLGQQAILEKLGAEPTGLPFNSVTAIEQQATRVGNPLVNAGAIATTSLLEGKSAAAKWKNILAFYSACAGEELELLKDIYESEAATNARNQAIARLLDAYGVMYDDPEKAVDVYTRQCSVGITTKQLAAMGATLAAGGINPFTGVEVMNAENIPQILSIMLSCGMYDYSGTWSYLTGLPAKSGVGGGIVAVVPGKGAIAAFSPRLDGAGNSIRAQKAIAYISQQLNINIFDPQSVGVE
ncbi:glutaminase A [Carboxylicivirga sediminis]|uniref:Glutaminase n=1 Tax=Carboxylicivirga sediminis TaxID=2006564 RepID=A0A941F5N2_9BACT|nr:glutaminase A [Carboxylicivirga sediminis]MBR8536822.1 glutaminase A [Carboxylicivirga sediminis]